MKKIGYLAAAALLVSSFSYAYTSEQNPDGFYAGLQLGYANTHYNASNLTEGISNISIGSVDNQGVGGRINVGYDFNKYFALETGLVILPKVKINNINNITASGLNRNASFTQSILDLIAKGTLPLDYGFDLYAKGGVANVRRDNAEVEINGVTVKLNDSDNKTVGVLGLGADYRITDHVFMDLGYTRYLGNGDLKPTDFVALGIAYRF